MSQQRLNNIMLLNVHKDLTDGLDLPTIARQFVDVNERRLQAFLWHCAQSTMKPTRALGLTLGTVRLELFGNLTIAFIFVYSLLQTLS